MARLTTNGLTVYSARFDSNGRITILVGPVETFKLLRAGDEVTLPLFYPLVFRVMYVGVFFFEIVPIGGIPDLRTRAKAYSHIPLFEMADGRMIENEEFLKEKATPAIGVTF